jgi:hypothetical protein
MYAARVTEGGSRCIHLSGTILPPIGTQPGGTHARPPCIGRPAPAAAHRVESSHQWMSFFETCLGCTYKWQRKREVRAAHGTATGEERTRTCAQRQAEEFVTASLSAVCRVSCRRRLLERRALAMHAQFTKTCTEMPDRLDVACVGRSLGRVSSPSGSSSGTL